MFILFVLYVSVVVPGSFYSSLFFCFFPGLFNVVFFGVFSSLVTSLVVWGAFLIFSDVFVGSDPILWQKVSSTGP